MHQQGLLAVCFLASIACLAAAGNRGALANVNYAIVSSQVLRPGVPYRIGVTVFPRSPTHGLRSVTARLNATKNGENFTRVLNESSWQGKPGEVRQTVDLTILLSMSRSELDQMGSHKLEVALLDTMGNRYVNSSQVSLSDSPVTTLIQTDKAVYKPGQQVKFRVVNLDESLKPVLMDMEVLIKDSRSNLVDKQTHNLSALQSWQNKAVMTGQLPLSEMPNEGDWTIEVRSQLGSQSKTFSVRKYVLPKFALEVTMPSFVYFGDKDFTVRARVRYTFDKAVEGVFNATIGPFMNCMSCKERYDLLETFTLDAKSDGEASFTFNLVRWRESLRAKGISDRADWYSAKATVVFTEKFTGEVKQEDREFFIYTQHYSSVKVEAPDVRFFLPGFNVPVQVSLERPDNQPFTGRAASNVTVSVAYQQRGKRRVQEVFQGPLSVSPSGTGISLSVRIPATADFLPVRIEASVLGEDGGEKQGQTTVRPFVSVTDDYVKLTMSSVNENIKMKLNKSSGIRFAYYTVLSHGQMQQWGRFPNSGHVTLTKADLTSYATDATIVAFGLAPNGEIVAAAAIHKPSRFGGRVSLRSNLTKNSGEPQQWARVIVTAEPETFVFLTGIDASVNLLATGQDILQSTVANKYKDQSTGVPFREGFWRWNQQLTTGEIIRENNLIVLSDAFYTDTNYEMADSRKRGGMALEFASVETGSVGRGGGSPIQVRTQVRKFFPETMVWTVVRTSSEGEASHAFVLPDTITSWDLTGFGVAQDRQVQTMDEAFKVTTFKSFFIRPVLPYSVVRGEKFLLKVLLFNYRSTDGRVTVSLNVSKADGEARATAGQTAAASAKPGLPSVEVAARANSGGMAVFELTPRALPGVELTLSGTFSSAEVSETDVVVKSVIVVPEGETVHRSRSVLLTAGGADQSVAVEFPALNSSELVTGSEVLGYSLIGDVMGPAMHNIGRLLRLPSGCGEQNMVNFAPAVFIWEYLSSTKQASDEQREKAFNVMKVGLQRQLIYKRLDGSFSAFGQEDAAGSAWLTAFVLDVFARASAFIAIEPEALTGSSVKFLLERQGVRGDFSEPPGARVLDRNLQGSSAQASHGMTAFICLALLDVDETARARPALQSTTWKELDVKGGITKCLWFVQAAFESRPSAFSAYDVALSAYLLRRAQASAAHRQASLQRGLDALEAALSARAETDANGGKFWSSQDPVWSWRGTQGSVEATAWALLDSTLAGDTETSLRILRWLSGQQTNMGGFSTSQATVVGIRALAAFAGKSGLVAGDAGIELQLGDSSRTLSVPEARRLVLVQGPLLRAEAARVGAARLRHVSGSGFALATISWQFNLLDRRPLSPDWKTVGGLGIRLGSREPSPPAGNFRLSVCARANASDGMLILRVTNPSGFSASSLPPLNASTGLKRVEAGPIEVVMYLDFLSPRGTCVTIEWVRDVPVLDLSPQLIILQKYYNTEQAVKASYLAPELQALTECSACPECPACKFVAPREAWLHWLI